MTTPPTHQELIDELAQAIADARSDADALDRTGNERQATYLRELVTKIEASTKRWRTFHATLEASLYSGKTPSWLNQRYQMWARTGDAYTRGRIRYFRECVLPVKADPRGAYAAGIAEARVASMERAS